MNKALSGPQYKIWKFPLHHLMGDLTAERLPSGKCALLCQGGGGKGAWQAGVIKGLSNAGIDFVHFSGTSIGALNATFAYADKIDAMESLWKVADSDNVFRILKWPVFRNGLYSDSFLREVVLENFPDNILEARSSGRHLHIWVTDLSRNTSRMIIYGSRRDSPFQDFLVASCSIPGVFPCQNICDGMGTKGRYSDGGIVANNPVRPEFIQSESGLAGLKFVVDICPLTSEEVPDTSVLAGTINAAMNEQVRMGLKFAQHVVETSTPKFSPKIKFYVIQPSKKLSSHLRQFTPETCQEDFTLGLHDAGEFLGNPHLCDITALNFEPVL